MSEFPDTGANIRGLTMDWKAFGLAIGATIIGIRLNGMIDRFWK